MTLPDSDSLSTFGGPFLDYGVGVVDPSTDLAAAQYNALAADVAGMSRMVLRCEVVFVGGTSPTFSSFDAVWKGGTSTAPTIAWTSTGVYTATFPTSVNDELGVAHTLNLHRALGQVEGGATAYITQCTASANVITIRTFNTSGTATDPTGANIVCWAR